GLSWPAPDHNIQSDFLDRDIPALSPTAACCDNQSLAADACAMPSERDAPIGYQPMLSMSAGKIPR
ncbi:hypothetical protein B5P41_33845, partial [Bacillus sp. SRB_28]